MRKLWKRIRFMMKIRTFVPFLRDFFLSKEVGIGKKLGALGLMGGYMLLPLDLIPDFLSFFGILDDVTVFIFVLQLICRMAPQQLQDKYDIS